MRLASGKLRSGKHQPSLSGSLAVADRVATVEADAQLDRSTLGARLQLSPDGEGRLGLGGRIHAKALYPQELVAVARRWTPKPRDEDPPTPWGLPPGLSAALTLGAESIEGRDYRLQAVALDAALADGRLTLENIALRSGPSRLQRRAVLDLTGAQPEVEPRARADVIDLGNTLPGLLRSGALTGPVTGVELTDAPRPGR